MKKYFGIIIAVMLVFIIGSTDIRNDDIRRHYDTGKYVLYYKSVTVKDTAEETIDNFYKGRFVTNQIPRDVIDAEILNANKIDSIEDVQAGSCLYLPFLSEPNDRVVAK